MDADFAAYAWENDLRIGEMTGQPFTLAYRENVLSNHRQPFDSGSATLVLTAVSLTNPAREVEVLSALQHARYVEGLDVTSLPVLAALLERMGLRQEAGRLLLSDAELLEVNQHRVLQAQLLMHESGARGVPAFITGSSGKRQVVNTAGMYSETDKWISQILA